MEKTGLLVGMTGQSGAGKTTVSEMLKSRGLTVIDADVVARSVVENGKKCLLDLALEFGTDILLPDGTLNRRKLGNMVFASRQKRIRLNQITFPYIQEEIYAEVERLRSAGTQVIFLDAPTLFESGTDKSCDKIISVIAPETMRLERILARDSIEPQEAQNRMKSQYGDDFYIKRSDFVIRNEGDINELRVQIMQMLDFLGL